MIPITNGSLHAFLCAPYTDTVPCWFHVLRYIASTIALIVVFVSAIHALSEKMVAFRSRFKVWRNELRAWAVANYCGKEFTTAAALRRRYPGSRRNLTEPGNGLVILKASAPVPEWYLSAGYRLYRFVEDYDPWTGESRVVGWRRVYADEYPRAFSTAETLALDVECFLQYHHKDSRELNRKKQDDIRSGRIPHEDD